MIWMRSAAVMTLAAAVAIPGHSDRPSAETAALSSLPAVVSPVRTADVAAQVDGDVVRLYVREGDAVMAGQSLARINDRIPQAQVNLAQAAARCEADLELAQSELRQAKRIYQRLLKGRALGVISEAEAEKAETDVEIAQARLRRVKEECRQKQLELELQQARLNAHVLTAPFDGDVLRIEQQVGSTVTQGMPVVRIADLSRLRAVVFVPYAWHADLRPGVVLPVRADVPLDRVLDAVVVSVEPVIDAATRTFRCIVEIDNRDRSLPAGFTIVVEETHVEAMKMARAKGQTTRR